MRNPDRIWPFLTTLAKVWEKNPDLRFMQLICNIQAAKGTDCFYTEDEQMEEWLKKHLDKCGGEMV